MLKPLLLGFVAKWVSMLVLFVVFAGFGAILLASFQNSWQLYREGVTTEGQVIRKAITTDSEGDNNFNVEYRLTYRETLYTQTVLVSEEFYKTVEEGDTVTIVFLAEDPEVSDVHSQNTDWQFGLTCAIAGGGGLVFGLMRMLLEFYRNYRHLCAERHLIQNGMLINGEVISCTAELNENKDYIVKLSYRFVSPTSGDEIFNKDQATREDLWNAEMPSAGFPVKILYGSDTRYRVM